MKTWVSISLKSAAAVLTVVVATACGTDTSGTPPANGQAGAAGGSGGSGGTPGTGGGSGPAGAAGSAGTAGAAGGADASGGAAMGGSRDSGSAPVGMACEPRSAFTLAIHIVIDVGWNETTGANLGSGKFHIWNLAKMTATGTALTGTIQPCGNALPELTLKPLVGGGKVLVEVPPAVWDAPSAPKFPTTGTIAGWSVGSALMTTPTVALVGLTMPNPEADWPTSYTMVMSNDVDGDGDPGITGVPRVGPGYVQTPVSVPILGLGARADKLFLVSRTGLGLNGTMTSCTEQAGTVMVKFFDNHVVGCHVNGQENCTAAQTDFVDSNRTRYTVMGASFTSKIIADTATCAEARAL